MVSARGQQVVPLNRRQLLTSGGAGIAAFALGGLGFGAAPHLANALQIEATPPDPAFLQPVTPAGETVAEVAARLNYDAEAIFAFVRDEIGYESYAGVLRGSTGTLWSRAGNAADQAVLLGELLTAAQIPFRYAFGPLSPEHETVLTDSLARQPDTVRRDYEAALAGAVITAPSADTATPEVTLSPEQQEVVDAAIAQADRLKARAEDLIDPAVTSITEALAGANITLPEIPMSPLADLERSQHSWIQVSDGPEWTTLDPTIPEDQADLAVLTPDITAIAMPEELSHLVRIRIVAEEVFSGYPSKRDVLTWESPSHRLVNTPIAIAMTSPDTMAGVGLAITDQFNGTVSFSPCLIAGDDAATVTSTVVFGAGEGTGVLDVLGGDGSVADGETTGLWLIAEVTSPGAAPVSVERTLLDRVGAAARAAGTFDLEALAPLEFVVDQEGKQTLPAIAGLTVITVDVARLPTVYSIRDTRSADLYGQLHLFGPSFASFRNALVFEHGAAAGFDAYPSAPSLTAFTVNLADPTSATVGMEITADLLIQNLSLRPLGEAAPGRDARSPHVLTGVLNQVAEQVLVEPMVATADGQATNLLRPTIGAIFESAREAGIEIVALSGTDGLSGIDLADDTITTIQAALDSGLVVVLPRKAVPVGETAAIGWWLIDPVTGRTWDQVENGRGYAGGRRSIAYSLPSTDFAGYTKLINNLRVWAGPYIILGKCIGLVVANAALASDYSNSKDLVDAGIETFKNVNPKDAKGCV